MAVKLYKWQSEALNRMKDGCILCGGVGSGKSITSIAYYFVTNGGAIGEKYIPMKNPLDLYIITTARKRDLHEWEGELSPFLISPNKDCSLYSNKVVIDSWNNIVKYKDVSNAFFIFDEQRVVGWGTWSKTFVAIAKKNRWILLSATPGDTWMDYIPVFIANGFYKNKTEFIRRHVIFNRFVKYPKVDRYIDTARLEKFRRAILINMNYKKKTTTIKNDIFVSYNESDYESLFRKRWNIFESKPIKNASELCYLLRKSVNSDPSRVYEVAKIVKKHRKTIIFYNFDYELELLRKMAKDISYECSEWNGHRHDAVPSTTSWVYLVQYTAGSEGWNCITANTIIFFSKNYSYKIMRQAEGRIDRLNTPYSELYYYYLTSKAPIDLAVSKALKGKKNFNEKAFVERLNNDI